MQSFRFVKGKLLKMSTIRPLIAETKGSRIVQINANNSLNVLKGLLHGSKWGFGYLYEQFTKHT